MLCAAIGPPAPPLLRVLVVDDSRACRRAVRALLARRGYAVVAEAASAAEALDLAARVHPEAALVDLHLPDDHGFRLAGDLVRRHPGLAVLLMSSDPPTYAYPLLEASGARGLVDKARLAELELSRFWPAVERP